MGGNMNAREVTQYILNAAGNSHFVKKKVKFINIPQKFHNVCDFRSSHPFHNIKPTKKNFGTKTYFFSIRKTSKLFIKKREQKRWNLEALIDETFGFR